MIYGNKYFLYQRRHQFLVIQQRYKCGKQQSPPRAPPPDCNNELSTVQSSPFNNREDHCRGTRPRAVIESMIVQWMTTARPRRPQWRGLTLLSRDAIDNSIAFSLSRPQL